MKVTNQKIHGASTKVEGAKTGRADSANSLKKDIGASPLSSREMKDGAKVDVSERAQMMQRAKDIASESSVDEAKVARFQKLIDEGKYNVDADKVADRLVDEHLLIPD